MTHITHIVRIQDVQLVQLCTSEKPIINIEMDSVAQPVESKFDVTTLSSIMLMCSCQTVFVHYRTAAIVVAIFGHVAVEG